MKRITHKAKSRLKTLGPRYALRKLASRRQIQKFADDLGFVYFGYVDQKDDDHRLVRGITASSSHGDHHYTVGTYKNYDVSLVIRRDSLEYPDRRIQDHYWTVMTFDLKTEYDLPHFYVAFRKRRDILAAKYSQLEEQPRTLYMGHEPRFFDLYTLFGSLGHTPEIALLLTPPITGEILRSFHDISIEVTEDTVYLYLSTHYPTRAELERLLRSGIWLSQALDVQAQRAHEFTTGVSQLEM